MQKISKQQQTINNIMKESEREIFRALLSSMERRKNRNFFVQFCVNDNVKAEYDMSLPFEIDAKKPQDWLNSCFFCYGMGKFGNGKVGLKIRLK